MNAYLIDTDVLIDHLRGVEKAYITRRLNCCLNQKSWGDFGYLK